MTSLINVIMILYYIKFKANNFFLRYITGGIIIKNSQFETSFLTFQNKGFDSFFFIISFIFIIKKNK